MDSSQKENKLNIGNLNDKIDKNHVELVEEKIN